MADATNTLAARPEGVTLGRQQVECLRKLLHVAEAGATTIESWPSHQADTPDRDWDWPTDVANHDLRCAMQHVSQAIVAIASGLERDRAE